MHIEVGWCTQDPKAQDPAALGVRFWSTQLKLRSVKHIRDFGGQSERGTVRPEGRAGRRAEKRPAGEPRWSGIVMIHVRLLLLRSLAALGTDVRPALRRP